MAVLGTLSNLFNNTNQAISGANQAQQQYWTNVDNYMRGMNNAWDTNMNGMGYNWMMQDPNRMNDYLEAVYKHNMASLANSSNGLNQTEAKVRAIMEILNNGVPVGNNPVSANPLAGNNPYRNSGNGIAGNSAMFNQMSQRIATLQNEINALAQAVQQGQ